jgi:hypothetical protein
VGRCMNWETLFTANEISRRVRDRYCRAPTRLRYGEGSVSGSPERSESMCGGHRNLDGFSFGHVALLEKIKYVALLGENEAIWSRSSFHPEEVMKGA